MDLPLIYNYIEVGHDEIRHLIKTLGKEDIVGNDPQKYWNKNKICCKLELKDPIL